MQYCSRTFSLSIMNLIVLIYETYSSMKLVNIIYDVLLQQNDWWQSRSPNEWKIETLLFFLESYNGYTGDGKRMSSVCNQKESVPSEEYWNYFWCCDRYNLAKISRTEILTVFSTITFVSKQLKINDLRLGVFRATFYNLVTNYVNIMLKIGCLVKIERRLLAVRKQIPVSLK